MVAVAERHSVLDKVSVDVSETKQGLSTKSHIFDIFLTISVIIMSLPLLRFLQIPDNIDFDNVFLSDPSATESSSSPHLTASDDMLLDPTYWTDHPPRYRYLMQRILPLLPALETGGFHVRAHHWDWATDL